MQPTVPRAPPELADWPDEPEAPPDTPDVRLGLRAGRVSGSENGGVVVAVWWSKF